MSDEGTWSERPERETALPEWIEREMRRLFPDDIVVSQGSAMSPERLRIRVAVLIASVINSRETGALAEAEDAARLARAKHFPGTVVPGREPLPIPPGLYPLACLIALYAKLVQEDMWPGADSEDAAIATRTVLFLDALCRLWIARRAHGNPTG